MPAHSLSRLLRPALFTLALLASTLAASAQPTGWLDPSRFGVGAKYMGLSYHPGGGENEEHYLRSLDDKDYWVVLVGAQLDADYRALELPALRSSLMIRASTSFYKDCSDLWAGFYHLGFRANWDATPRFSVRIGVGPTYLWRQNWFGRVKGYTKDSFFGKATGGDYQGKYISYGGDFEAEWRAWPKVSLVYGCIPGWPEVIQNSVGLRRTF
jgi:hypothetical protein